MQCSHDCCSREGTKPAKPSLDQTAMERCQLIQMNRRWRLEARLGKFCACRFQNTLGGRTQPGGTAANEGQDKVVTTWSADDECRSDFLTRQVRKGEVHQNDVAASKGRR